MTKGSISFVAVLTLRFLSSKVFARFMSEKCSPVWRTGNSLKECSTPPTWFVNSRGCTHEKIYSSLYLPHMTNRWPCIVHNDLPVPDPVDPSDLWMTFKQSPSPPLSLSLSLSLSFFLSLSLSHRLRLSSSLAVTDICFLWTPNHNIITRHNIEKSDEWSWLFAWCYQLAGNCKPWLHD